MYNDIFIIIYFTGLDISLTAIHQRDIFLGEKKGTSNGDRIREEIKL